MADKLNGVFAIMATPFNDDGSLDLSSLKSETEFFLKAGVHGLVVLGIMGEAHKLSDEEKETVVETVSRHLHDRVPLVVGVSHSGVDLSIRWIQHANDAGAIAAMLLPPLVPRLGPEGITQYYRDVAGHASLPIVIHDEPFSTGVMLPSGLIADLYQEERIPYAKVEEAPTPGKISRVLELTSNRMRLFGGAGGLYFLEELRRGACGTMTGFAFPEVLVKCHAQAALGQWDTATTEFNKGASLIRFESQAGIGLPIRKEFLRLRGAIRSSFVRQPGTLLDPLTQEEIGQWFRDAELTL